MGMIGISHTPFDYEIFKVNYLYEIELPLTEIWNYGVLENTLMNEMGAAAPGLMIMN